MRMVGVEIYFEDLERARSFYEEELGLAVTDGKEGRFAQFGAGPFLCVERKGTENYPSPEKAVVFFEVPDLAAAVERLGRARFARIEKAWAVLPDPEGHSVMLLEARR
jgi:predicted enzyme related to lactoylglutathione lyase